MTESARKTLGPAFLLAGLLPGAITISGEIRAETVSPALVAKHAAAQGVPAPLAQAIVAMESRYNPRARGGSNIGLMQIQYRTAQGAGYRGPAAGLYDPETNLTYGMKYLAGAYRLAGGDTCRTIMKYSGGHRATRMTRGHVAYCGKVRAFMASGGSDSAGSPGTAVASASPKVQPAAGPVQVRPVATASVTKLVPAPAAARASGRSWLATLFAPRSRP
jgi:hypothetical protein